MKTAPRLFAAAALTILPVTAFAQADAHHPAADTGTPPAAAPATIPPPGTPADQTQNMMQMMGQMMPMMQQMMQMMEMMQQKQMQGGMMMGMQGSQGGPGGMGMPAASSGAPMAGMSEAGRAYMSAMTDMNGPMMQAIQIADPDVAFVKGMVAHHQGAIDMAKAVLQYGKDEQVKTWANQIIKAQEAEKAEMESWLKQHGQ